MTTISKYPSTRGSGKSLQQSLKRMAEKFGVDEYLLKMRARLNSGNWRDYVDTRNMCLLLAFALTEDANCIDIGANRGSVLDEIVRIAPKGQHIAYEPLPFLCEHLKERFPGVEVRQAAVSNEITEKSFTIVKNAPACSGFQARKFAKTHQTETIIVHTETLDESLPKGYVPSFIKIDVEGAERFVLEGAIKTISEHKPIIVFEHGRGGADYYDTQPRDIYALLHDEAKLRIFDLDGGGPYTLTQFEDAYARNNIWNFVAH
jgi:FkbM family methyltransferase